MYKITYRDAKGKGFGKNEPCLMEEIESKKELEEALELLKSDGCTDIQVANVDSDGWHIVLSTLNGNRIIPSENNPKESGEYLCTCISMSGGLEHRYLKTMEYDENMKRWHDVGNKNGISHLILAWKKETVCTFSNFEYKAGVLLEKDEVVK